MAVDGPGPLVIQWPEPARTAPTGAPGGLAGASSPARADFGEALSGALAEARGSEQVADQMSRRFAAGDPTVGIHEVMVAAEKASISLRYAVTLKNKLIEAYRELMNTPV